MSPIELIRKGILDSNWDDITKAYEVLTGSILKHSDEVVNTPVKSGKKLPVASVPAPQNGMVYISDLEISASEAELDKIIKKKFKKTGKRRLRDPYVDKLFICNRCGKECSMNTVGKTDIDKENGSKYTCMKCVRRKG